MPQPSELDEFRKQYCNTIIRMREDDGPLHPVYVMEEGAHTPNHLCVSHASLGLLQVKWNSKSYSFNTDLPERGLFNFNGAVGRFVRLPNRQWKRGLCTGTSEVHWLTQTWRHELNPVTAVQNPGFNNLAFTKTLFERTYRPWDAVIEDLITLKVAEEAISPKFAFSQSLFSNDDGLILWYEDQAVGELFPHDPGIVVRQGIFGQEIQDFAKRMNIKWPIKFTEA